MSSTWFHAGHMRQRIKPAFALFVRQFVLHQEILQSSRVLGSPKAVQP